MTSPPYVSKWASTANPALKRAPANCRPPVPVCQANWSASSSCRFTSTRLARGCTGISPGRTRTRRCRRWRPWPDNQLARYMYSGTWIPSTSKRPLQLGAKIIRHPQQKGLLLAIRLRQHRKFVIKIAESLGKLKSVPGHVRRLPAGDRALDRRARLSKPPAEAANNPRLEAAGPSPRALVRLGNPAALSPRSASLRRIFRARTAAYCTYGPVSPSKLSASPNRTRSRNCA